MNANAKTMNANAICRARHVVGSKFVRDGKPMVHVFPLGAKSQENLEHTTLLPVDVDGETYYIWALGDNPQCKRIYERMEHDDDLLFQYDGEYSYVAKFVSKIDRVRFEFPVAGEHPWTLMFMFKNLRKLETPISRELMKETIDAGIKYGAFTVRTIRAGDVRALI